MCMTKDKDPFVSVRVRRSVRTKAYKLSKKLTEEKGKHVKLHEAFDHRFAN
jgi:hypothetical protein